MAARKVNYLNNRDLLKEIHKSKTSYCWFKDPNYSDYDLILTNDLDLDLKKHLQDGKAARVERLNKIAEAQQETQAVLLEADCISDHDVVFRVMTWDHIPKSEIVKKVDKKTKTPVIEDDLLVIDDADVVVDELLEKVLKKEKPKKDFHLKVNFPPFVHYRINEDGHHEVVGLSHWKGGDRITGHFSVEHGKVSNNLALMYMKLCERYGTRGNWRGYCVDTETEALTKRGWLSIDEISEDDTILSYNNNQLTWSAIKSIYRGEFDGLMHKVTSRSIDALITPNHKIPTTDGLKPVELVKSSDSIIVMGNESAAPSEATFSDSFVELVGWVVTEGCYQIDDMNRIKQVTIYQNEGETANRIRNCLFAEGMQFSESTGKNIAFALRRSDSKKIFDVVPDKNLNMEFILSLTSAQRHLLINTMVDGDGRGRGENRSYVQKSKSGIDMLQALLAISGIKSNSHYTKDFVSFGKKTNFYTLHMFSARGNQTKGSCLNLHGGANNGAGTNRNRGKEAYPNVPTTHYVGRVWCPETEYGSFLARRNGKVYLTGNTYNDEMQSQALLQLSRIGLQFDEQKSLNPFAYYTAIVNNSFTQVFNVEKQHQVIRDDILESNSLNPSYTRQNSWSGDHSEGSE